MRWLTRYTGSRPRRRSSPALTRSPSPRPPRARTDEFPAHSCGGVACGSAGAAGWRCGRDPWSVGLRGSPVGATYRRTRTHGRRECQGLLALWPFAHIERLLTAALALGNAGYCVSRALSRANETLDLGQTADRRRAGDPDIHSLRCTRALRPPDCWSTGRLSASTPAPKPWRWPAKQTWPSCSRPTC
jgi:hypothetical protein